MLSSSMKNFPVLLGHVRLSCQEFGVLAPLPGDIVRMATLLGKSSGKLRLAYSVQVYRIDRWVMSPASISGHPPGVPHRGDRIRIRGRPAAVPRGRGGHAPHQADRPGEADRGAGEVPAGRLRGVTPGRPRVRSPTARRSRGRVTMPITIP